MLDLNRDFDLVISSFKHYYNLNLTEILAMPDRLFWIYLRDLGSETPLMRIIQLRRMDYADLNNQPELIQLKKAYELPNPTLRNQPNFESIAKQILKNRK